MNSKISKTGRKKARLELYHKLDAAEAQSRTCKVQASHKDVMARLKKASAGKTDSRARMKKRKAETEGSNSLYISNRE